ncbi:MAG: S-layer homology domain-containing protein [Actinomycetota bacterium]
MTITLTKPKLLAAVVAIVLLAPATAYAAGTFDDVPSGAFYEASVEWAADKEITTGKTPTTFAPNDAVTRAEAVTFLKRYEDNVVAPRVAAATAGLFGFAEEDSPVITSSLNPTTLGLSVSVTIPEGHTGRIEARFTAESVCTSTGTNRSWCEVDLLLDGTDVRNVNQAFDSTASGTATSDEWQSHATSMVTGVLEAGTYQIGVSVDNEQLALGIADPMSFYLDDMVLTAEVHLAS